MPSVKVSEAKATLSALLDAAERGEPTTITRHGRPVAVLVSVADAARLYPLPQARKAGLLEHLLAFPGGVELERDRTPMRDIDL